jgi:hypothetical protein
MSLVRMFQTSLVILCLHATAFAGGAPEVLAQLQERGFQVTQQDGQIVGIQYRDSDLTAADLKLVGECTDVKKLFLNGKALNDETLPLLAKLANLEEEFSSNQSQLSDSGYKHFQAFKNLKVLRLWHPSWDSEKFTGAGVAHLQALPKLEKLTVAGSTAGDPLMKAVGQITRLKEFQTWHTRQTQSGNDALLQLTQLESLKLGQRLPKWGTDSPQSLNADTIPTLAKLKSLTSLELFEARLTAESLLPLKQLPNLQKLKIHTVDISPAEIETLRNALPEVTISFEPLTDEQREMLTKKLRL